MLRDLSALSAGYMGPDGPNFRPYRKRRPSHKKQVRDETPSTEPAERASRSLIQSGVSPGRPARADAAGLRLGLLQDRGLVVPVVADGEQRAARQAGQAAAGPGTAGDPEAGGQRAGGGHGRPLGTVPLLGPGAEEGDGPDVVGVG